MALENDDREALIIRWRVIIILALVDYFSPSSKFNKIVTKELIDLKEGMIKALAKAYQISLVKSNGDRKGFNELMNDIRRKRRIPQTTKQKVRDINLELHSQTLSFFRNEETHQLNLSDIPDETVKRCCRLFDELVVEIDSEIFDYAKNRPEFKDFYYLHDFFKSSVLDNKFVDLSKIKEYSKIINGKQRGRPIHNVETSMERGIWEIINYIKEGNHIST
jgi:hypothetical protein